MRYREAATSGAWRAARTGPSRATAPARSGPGARPLGRVGGCRCVLGRRSRAAGEARSTSAQPGGGQDAATGTDHPDGRKRREVRPAAVAEAMSTQLSDRFQDLKRVGPEDARCDTGPARSLPQARDVVPSNPAVAGIEKFLLRDPPPFPMFRVFLAPGDVALGVCARPTGRLLAGKGVIDGRIQPIARSAGDGLGTSEQQPGV